MPDVGTLWDDWDGSCQRCFEKTNGHIMSMFNTQLICFGCKDTETKRDDYAKACDVEHEAVKAGDYNFKGVHMTGANVNRVGAWPRAASQLYMRLAAMVEEASGSPLADTLEAANVARLQLGEDLYLEVVDFQCEPHVADDIEEPWAVTRDDDDDDRDRDRDRDW